MSETRTVALTGASTGIGRAAVAELVGYGFKVWATVRREDDAESLSAEFGSAVTPVVLDLTDHDSVREAGARICEAGPLHGLVNNAGTAFPGPLELIPIEVFQRQLDIGLTGQLLMTQVLLPALRASAAETGDARIVMIGSVGGRIAGRMLGAYVSAKHGLVGLSGALRGELAPWGIRVILIEPGSIATPIWDRGTEAGAAMQAADPAAYARYADQLAQSRAMAEHGYEKGISPRVPALAILEALTHRNPAPRVAVGRDAKAVAVLVRVLPFRAIYRLTGGRRPPRR